MQIRPKMSVRGLRGTINPEAINEIIRMLWDNLNLWKLWETSMILRTSGWYPIRPSLLLLMTTNYWYIHRTVFYFLSYPRWTLVTASPGTSSLSESAENVRRTNVPHFKGSWSIATATYTIDVPVVYLRCVGTRMRAWKVLRNLRRFDDLQHAGERVSSSLPPQSICTLVRKTLLARTVSPVARQTPIAPSTGRNNLSRK